MPLDIDPLYAFYAFAAMAAVLVVEAAYLLLSGNRSYRNGVNRRLALSGQEANREKVLVQLRRERGLTAEGSFFLPLPALNRLIIQSGIAVKPTRIILTLALFGTGGFVGAFWMRG